MIKLIITLFIMYGILYFTYNQGKVNGYRQLVNYLLKTNQKQTVKIVSQAVLNIFFGEKTKKIKEE